VRHRRIAVIAIAALFLAAIAAGLVVAERFGSERIVSEVETRLGAALQTKVTIGSLRVRPGTFIRVEGERLRAWQSESDVPPGLEIQRVSGSIDAFSLLGGEIQLARLKVEGAQLRLVASGTRGWSASGTEHPTAVPEAVPEAAPEAQPAADSDPPPTIVPGTREGDVAQPLEWLAPLISLETAFRRAMSAPHAAGVLEFSDVTIAFLSEGEGEDERGALRLEKLSGRLVHRRFGGGSDLHVAARVSEGGRDRGGIELTGRRERDDSVRIVMKTDALELAAGARYIRGFRAHAKVEGQLTGEWTYETPEFGSGRLQIDVALRDLRSSLPDGGAALQAISSPKIDVSGALEISPQSATLRDIRIANRDTALAMSGEVGRPLQNSSMATVELSLLNLELAQARHLIGWLPEIERREAAAVLAPLKRGRLATLNAKGSATLSRWQHLLAGRTRRMPRGFRMQVELADTVAWVADTNRLEGLSAKLRWEGNRVEIERADAVLNGTPLPTLDLVIDGFPNFLAGKAELREMNSAALPLLGLGALWESLRPKGAAVSADIGTQVDLEIASLVHPLFIWPMWDVSAAIEARPKHLAIHAKRATWAGVPIRGKADWTFGPDERVSIRLVADRPAADSSVPPHEENWAHGAFEVGPIHGDRWKQQRAAGNFEASGGRVRIRDLEIDLLPSGSARADGALELSIRGRVPYRANFGVVDGNASALAKLVGLPEHQVTGRIEGDGSFEGKLEPGASFFDQLSGLLDLRGFDGEIRKVSPPVVAISEATRSIDSFDPRDVVAFERVDAVLEFTDGRLFSEAFSLDGPKIGVVAKGEVQLGVQHKSIDAEVFLLLFRKLDRVLVKIPILNRLLLGTDENLIAAGFHVTGLWSDPQVDSIPLNSSAGPASQVLQGVPLFVMRGIRALGSWVRLDRADDDAPQPQSGS
jgi:hypothetical protein